MDYTAFKARALEINKEVSDTSVSTQGNEDTIKHMLGVVDSDDAPERNSETSETVDPVEPEVFTMTRPDSWVNNVTGIWPEEYNNRSVPDHYMFTNTGNGVIFLKFVKQYSFNPNDIDQDVIDKMPSYDLVKYMRDTFIQSQGNSFVQTIDGEAFELTSSMLFWSQYSWNYWLNNNRFPVPDMLELFKNGDGNVSGRFGQASQSYSQFSFGVVEVFKGTD